MSSRLITSVLLPVDSAWNTVELKLLVDDQDVIGKVFDRGPWRDPDALLGPDSPLLPADEPREVMLAEADCTWGCCGAVFVRVRRDGRQVVWDQWRNPDDSRLSMAEVRFDLAQYEAELARAHRERSWEWTGRAVARLVRARLRKESTVLARWNSGLEWTQSMFDAPGHVEVSFTSPPRHVVNDHWRATGELMDYIQFLARFPVSEEPAESQADRIVAALHGRDPRKDAVVCGGSPARR
ncbi:hypothetical protein [Actinokineospora xionganensis]|uniref:TIGR04255 family protein n=1 Tax=Actinokineospora xionganensis TaxID=2684470 RepID=A0ABR7LG51_9PSEU|nr:hypothetical protein [Actinokineospora xionganensis]MBC6451691.1 hypothetical protein [Actinokineospora xionganensis]